MNANIMKTTPSDLITTLTYVLMGNFCPFLHVIQVQSLLIFLIQNILYLVFHIICYFLFSFHKYNIIFLSIYLRLLEEVKPVLENTDYTVQRTGGNEITIQSVMLQVNLHMLYTFLIFYICIYAIIYTGWSKKKFMM